MLSGICDFNVIKLENLSLRVYIYIYRERGGGLIVSQILTTKETTFRKDLCDS